ncbi:uncharacterized protein Z520_00334 [Fonsecaea multimorphosa CBS 102226]|uniref:Uncharacterized protein n=1 Tax=Fonsecaea multimorphosa CBS 102226 TaxID=1442371 RepID=A0A0D2KBZ6_9EURO|nr:uncharacterized protein Z520_00334 [Fonsecaea multimorphosa CBS 102226]KIY03643.1 hypothetical protein Z520_00334 [Fonsecaea multimorphosa CBS 102226]
MANMASVDARTVYTHATHVGGAKEPSGPGHKMLRIERQEGRGPTSMRQSSQTLDGSLTLGTLNDELAMSGFGLGGPEEARRGGDLLAGDTGRVGCRLLRRCKSGR